MAAADCELCRPECVLLEGSLAYVRYDSNSLSRGHVLVIPRRHVASYFDMTTEEKTEIQSLLDRAQSSIAADHSPDGYNIGVNIGRAAGQNRMHVHVHSVLSGVSPDIDADVVTVRRMICRNPALRAIKK